MKLPIIPLHLLGWHCINVQSTTNGMCAKNSTHIYVAQTSNNRVISSVISIVDCCHSVKLCVLAAWAFLSQQNGAVTRMWQSCQVQPSQKDCVIGVVRWKRKGCCCNLSVGIALNVRFAMNRMCAKNSTHIYVTWTSNYRLILSVDLYCCLLPVWSFVNLPLGLSDCNNTVKKKVPPPPLPPFKKARDEMPHHCPALQHPYFFSHIIKLFGLLLSAVTVSLHYLPRCLRWTIAGRKMITAATWSEPLKICCHVVVTQQRPIVEQSTPNFRYLPLQANEQTWVNCKAHHGMTPEQ